MPSLQYSPNKHTHACTHKHSYLPGHSFARLQYSNSHMNLWAQTAINTVVRVFKSGPHAQRQNCDQNCVIDCGSLSDIYKVLQSPLRWYFKETSRWRPGVTNHKHKCFIISDIFKNRTCNASKLISADTMRQSFKWRLAWVQIWTLKYVSSLIYDIKEGQYQFLGNFQYWLHISWHTSNGNFDCRYDMLYVMSSSYLESVFW